MLSILCRATSFLLIILVITFWADRSYGSDIYISQSGDNFTLDVRQDGNNHLVRGYHNQTASIQGDNNIGIGAIVRLSRSGDVIPKVHKVVKQATEAKMPSSDMNVKWNSSGVDLILVDKNNDETVKNKTILGFFKKIQVDGLKQGNINKIIQAGFNEIDKILSMTVEDFMKIPGFKEKMSTKIYNSIQYQINNVFFRKGFIIVHRIYNHVKKSYIK